MRDLNTAELEMVAGGGYIINPNTNEEEWVDEWWTDTSFYTDDIVVRGYVPLSFFDMWALEDNMLLNPFNIDYYATAEEAGVTGIQHHPTNLTTEQIQQETDTLAKKIQQDIIADRSHKSQELLAFQYINENGQVVNSRLLYDVDGDKKKIAELIEEIGKANIVGMVHNHDRQTYSENAYENRMPSDNDWQSAKILDSANGDLPFSSYIIDTRDNIREYSSNKVNVPTAVMN